MKNQKYQVVIEDFLPNNQVLKLWNSIGLEVLSPEEGNSTGLLYKNNEISSGFTWKNGVLTFHGDKNLFISTRDMEKQYRKINNQNQSIKKQPFAKALGLKNRGEKDWVLDGTMGLGKDYFLAKCFGFDVVGVERSQLCLALVGTFLFHTKESISSCFCYKNTASLIEKLCSEKEKTNIFKLNDSGFFSTNLNSEKNNGFLFGPNKNPYPSVIFLDPMYDEMNETALPTKGMQILRKELLPSELAEFEKLFLTSLDFASNRVVIKRSLKAEVKFKKYFSYSFEGKSTRYDVYLKT